MTQYQETSSGLLVPAWAEAALNGAQGISVPRSEERLRELRATASTLKRPLRNPAKSAVLVLLGGDARSVDRPDDAVVVLTHRATTLRKHAGQMAFPGGRVDDTDRDAIHTALREAEEETGLDPNSVTTMGVLDPIDISRSGFAVEPVLAYWHAPHPLAAVDPAETHEVLTVPITELVNPDNRLQVGFRGWQGPAFKVGDYIVWGFTGGVLAHLLDASGWSQPWDRDNVQDLQTVLAASANGETFMLGGKLK